MDGICNAKFRTGTQRGKTYLCMIAGEYVQTADRSKESSENCGLQILKGCYPKL